MTYSQWHDNWLKDRPHERLGQAFVLDFIKGTWSDLFHCVDDFSAQQVIITFLKDCQHWPSMPPMMDREYQSIRQSFIYGN